MHLFPCHVDTHRFRTIISPQRGVMHYGRCLPRSDVVANLLFLVTMIMFLYVVMLDFQFSILLLATLSASCTGRLQVSLSLSLSLCDPFSLPLRDSL